MSILERARKAHQTRQDIERQALSQALYSAVGRILHEVGGLPEGKYALHHTGADHEYPRLVIQDEGELHFALIEGKVCLYAAFDSPLSKQVLGHYDIHGHIRCAYTRVQSLADIGALTPAIPGEL